MMHRVLGYFIAGISYASLVIVRMESYGTSILILTYELGTGLISVEVMASFGTPVVDTTLIADKIAVR